MQFFGTGDETLFCIDTFVSFLTSEVYSHLKYDRVDVIVVKEKPRHQLFIFLIFLVIIIIIIIEISDFCKNSC